MRTMYDAVTASNIPADAEMVAGYVDQIVLKPWSAADWARFPNAVKVEIVKKASSNFGHVLDVEKGDATPGEAPGWVRTRRAAGADPTIYVNASTWPVVRAEMVAQSVAQPHYWIAKYDSDPTIPASWASLGCVAKQYRGDVAPGYDVSSVPGEWPGVDSAPSNGGGSPAAGAGVEIMERKSVPLSQSTTSVRLLLSGSRGAAIIIRPKLDAKGFATNPVFLGNVFAWGSDHSGVGSNPKNIPGYDFKITSHRRIELPGAVWADVEYSSQGSFDIDIVG